MAVRLWPEVWAILTVYWVHDLQIELPNHSNGDLILAHGQVIAVIFDRVGDALFGRLPVCVGKTLEVHEFVSLEFVDPRFHLDAGIWAGPEDRDLAFAARHQIVNFWVLCNPADVAVDLIEIDVVDGGAIVARSLGHTDCLLGP